MLLPNPRRPNEKPKRLPQENLGAQHRLSCSQVGVGLLPEQRWQHQQHKQRHQQYHEYSEPSGVSVQSLQLWSFAFLAVRL